MKARPLIIPLVLLLQFIILPTVLGQIEQKTLTDELFCKNKNHEFDIEGNQYLEGSKVYVCPKNLPVMVTVVNASGSGPIPGAFGWKINDVPNTSSNHHTIVVDSSDFVSSKVVLECDFVDSLGIAINSKIKLQNNIKVTFDEEEKRYQYDDNKEEAYIQSYGGIETVGTPWNFIASGDFDVLKAKVNRGKGFYAVNNIVANNDHLTIDPTAMTAKKEEITLNYTNNQLTTNHETVEVRACDAANPELLLFVAQRDTFNIEFIRVCDTDDDVQVLMPGTIVTNPTDVCIDGGDDKTVDRMLDPTFLIGDDKLLQNLSGDVKVVAGINLICETKAHPNGAPECPNDFDKQASLEFTNGLFNKVGITIIDSTDPAMSILYMNYNIYSEDGVMEGREQSHVRNSLHGMGNPPMDGISEIYLVNDLGVGANNIGGNVQGRANLGLNTFALDVIDANKKVMSHELGHAKWGLEHPGGPSRINPDGTIYNGQFGIDDKQNFMHGLSNEIIKWKARRYQLNEIH